ncbi:MAG TPA: TonB-dependent receptor, partial [Chitinophagales bacterium]|nr:TonB-dependent receptor [Chitinophagales bacterium]
MTLNRYPLLVFFILAASQLFAQNAKLTGKVSEESGDALISANVVIDAAKGWAAVTDFDGKYEIDLPAGTYTVSFKYIGKDEQKKTVTLAAGETKVLDVVMKEKQDMMKEVVVTGSKYEKPLGEETVSMDVIKGGSLNNQNITDLGAGMTKVPSVTIADGQVNIRGGAGWSYGAGSRVQVLIDDLPLLTADANDAKWSIVPMENVDQVEVIKGAASALYGSGALDGIVNVRTAYPLEEPYFRINVYAGITEKPTITPDLAGWWSNNPKDPNGIVNFFNVIHGNPWGTGASFVYRQKFGQNDFVLNGAINSGTGFVDSSDSHDMRINAKYRYRFKNIPGLNMGVNGSAYFSWGKTFFFWNGLDSNGYKPFPNTITVYKSYRFTVDPFIDYYDKKDNHIKFLGRFFDATNTNNTGQGSVPILYYTELQYLKKFDFKKFDMHLVAGAVNTYDDVNPPKNASGSLFGKNSADNFSLYTQLDFKFFKKLNVSVGARWEYFKMWHYVQDSTTGDQILDTVQTSIKQLPYPLFRIGLNYQAAEATYIRASFGQGFRYPSIAER